MVLTLLVFDAETALEFGANVGVWAGALSGGGVSPGWLSWAWTCSAGSVVSRYISNILLLQVVKGGDEQVYTQLRGVAERRILRDETPMH